MPSKLHPIELVMHPVKGKEVACVLVSETHKHDKVSEEDEALLIRDFVSFYTRCSTAWQWETLYVPKSALRSTFQPMDSKFL